MIILRKTKNVNTTTGNMHFKKCNFTIDPFLLPFWHFGTSSSGLPQRASFIMNDLAVKFLKTPPLGISPCSLLEKRLTNLIYRSDSRDLGISPDKLF